MSKCEPTPDFQIECSLEWVHKKAEEKIFEADVLISNKRLALIDECTEILKKKIVGWLWWKRPRYGTHQEAYAAAINLVCSGKMPYEEFYYSDDIHFQRVELLQGWLVQRKKFLQELLKVHGVQGIRLNARAYRMLTE
jgi:hypothetical protein